MAIQQGVFRPHTYWNSNGSAACMWPKRRASWRLLSFYGRDLMSDEIALSYFCGLLDSETIYVKVPPLSGAKEATRGVSCGEFVGSGTKRIAADV